MVRCRCLVELLCCAAATASYVRLNEATGAYDDRAGVCLEKMFINGPDNADGKDGVCSKATNAEGRLLGNCKQTQAVLDCCAHVPPAADPLEAESHPRLCPFAVGAPCAMYPGGVRG